jgi:integrase/recombinase XerD
MQKPKVTLIRIVHREIDAVKICFDINEEITKLLKTLPHLKWSQTHKAWYVPYKETVSSEIFKLLYNKAYIDYSAVRKVKILEPVKHEKLIVNIKNNTNSAAKALPNLSSKQEEKVDAYVSWLRSKRYSESTVATYTDALRLFLRYFINKAVEEINNDDLIHFNNAYILRNNCSGSYQNQVVNAVKLFFSRIENKKLVIELIHRPKRAKTLPNVLSKEEVKQILMALSNVKHKTMLGLIYSCGLRCGELINLKFEHFDYERGLVLIKQSKGKKDRIVPLSQKTMIMIKEYLTMFKPQKYLFEGMKEGEAYDARSLQNVLKQSLAKSNIRKPVTLHWLRHSYATHLLENGTDLRYIQELLGHNSSRTTEIYTHVSTQSIQKIVSPFDYL